jgi:hypothetical protein
VCILAESCQTLVATGVCERADVHAKTASISTVTVPPASYDYGCGGGFSSSTDAGSFPDADDAGSEDSGVADASADAATDAGRPAAHQPVCP